MNWKLFASGTTGTCLIVVLFYAALHVHSHLDAVAVWLNLLILNVGLSSGWGLGILISPYTLEEKKQFSQYAKTLSLFVSGYLLAKVDSLVSHVLSTEFLSDPVSAFRVMMFIASLLVSAILTFVFRKYP
jgi:hypothetical protein